MITEQRLDALFDNPLIGWAWVFVPLCVLALSLQLTRRLPGAIRIISALLFTLATLDFCFFAPLQWALRDGMAVGMIKTHGEQAVTLFMEGFVPLTVMSASLIVVGLFVCSLPWFFEKDAPRNDQIHHHERPHP